MSCRTQITLDHAASFPSLTWREDIILPAPILVGPRNNSVFCLDSQIGLGFIILQWNAVAGATEYLIQWSNNPQMQGASIREAVVVAPTTTYTLLRDVDIRQGEEIYWRVIAASGTSGATGASAQSETRKISYKCEDNEQQKEEDKSQEFDIYLEIGGKDWMECCDRATYFIYISYANRDQFGRELITLDSVEWSVKNESGTVKIEDSANDFKKIIETCIEETQVIQICVNASFTDKLTSSTFNKQVCKCVTVDCAKPKWRDLDCDQKAISVINKYQTGTTAQPLEHGPGWEYITGEDSPDFCTKHVVATGPVFVVETEETQTECCGIVTDCCDCVPEEIPTCLVFPQFPTLDNEDKACFKFVYDRDLEIWEPDRPVVTESGELGLCALQLRCSELGWVLSGSFYDPRVSDRS